MKCKLLKFEKLGHFASKSSIFIFSVVLLMIFSGCSLNAKDDTNNERSSILTDFGTTWLRLQILNIYDSPQGMWNHTITACDLASYVSCIEVSHVFNHLRLPDIGIEIGSIVKVEVDAMRILPLPAPLFIHNWEMID